MDKLQRKNPSVYNKKNSLNDSYKWVPCEREITQWKATYKYCFHHLLVIILMANDHLHHVWLR